MAQRIFRVGVVTWLHESNTFVDSPTTLADYARDLLLTGEAVRTALASSYHEVGGFFAGLEAAGLEAVPIFAARALPGGPVTAETFTTLSLMLERALEQAGPLDGLLAAPHGAMVAENAADADGRWLSFVRDRLGGRPVIATIDPHANLSAEMISATDALIAYRTNPHLDQRARGLEAARLMALTLAGQIKPTQSAAFPPLAIPIDCQDPSSFPCLPHYRAAAALREPFEAWDAVTPPPRGLVLSSSIVLGFPYADVETMGSAVIVVTHDDAAAACRHAETLGESLWTARDTFTGELLGVEEAVAKAAVLPGPVCLLDMGDNVGGGSPADGTVLLRVVRRQRVAGSLAILCDAAAAAAAHATGIGGCLEIAVGGRSPIWQNLNDAAPLPGPWTVTRLTDGRFAENQPRHGGATAFDQGPTAVLEGEGGLTVMVTTERMAPFSLVQIRHAGLDPAAFRLLVAKGVHAPVAAYGEVCRTFLRVDTPGVTTADPTRLPHRHRRRPLHPFERSRTMPTGLSLLEQE